MVHLKDKVFFLDIVPIFEKLSNKVYSLYSKSSNHYFQTIPADGKQQDNLQRAYNIKLTYPFKDVKKGI